jgi:hypothetical protein
MVVGISVGNSPSNAGAGSHSISIAKIEREPVVVGQVRSSGAQFSSSSPRGVKARPFPKVSQEGSSGPGLRSFKRKRSWYMSVSTARNNAAGFARFAVNNSSPSGFSSDPDLIGSQWEGSRSGRCLRVSYSRVDCYYVFYSETFDLIVNDEIVGTDFFFCDGFLSSWYPRGTRRTIKDRVLVPECLWNSDR